MDYTVLIFGLPLAGVSYDEFIDLIKEGYIANEEMEYTEPTIFVSINKIPERTQQLFNEHTNATTATVINEETIVGLQVLPEYKDDYELFLKGKYSQMSAKAQREIIFKSSKFGNYAKRVFDKDTQLLDNLINKYAITRNHAGNPVLDTNIEKAIRELGEVLEKPQKTIRYESKSN